MAIPTKKPLSPIAHHLSLITMQRNSFDTVLQNLWYRLKTNLSGKSTLARLLQINIFIFVLVNISGLVGYLANLDHDFLLRNGMFPFTYYLSLPASYTYFAHQCWGIITYMFTHESFFHILMNMLILYVSAQLFIRFLGNNRLLSTYLLGGITGGLFFILAYNFLPVFASNLNKSYAIGASASVLAIFTAVATYVPNYKIRLVFIGDIALKYIVFFFIILDLVSVRVENPGGHIAHLGGVFYGWLSVWLWQKGIDIHAYVTSIVNGLYQGFRKSLYKNSNQNNKRKKGRQKKSASNTQKSNSKELNRIIEKVKNSGYGSLSEEEKRRLFE